MAIEANRVDVVIVRGIDLLTRNLTGWNTFEKACVRHGVRLSAYTRGEVNLSTPEGAYYGGMETQRAKRRARSKARGSARRPTGTRGRAGGRAAPLPHAGAPRVLGAGLPHGRAVRGAHHGRGSLVIPGRWRCLGLTPFHGDGL